MDFFELVSQRESIRSYDPQRFVDEETLERILVAGHLAPSAANRQPWEFLVIRSQAALDRIRSCYVAPWFQDAPQVLAVVGCWEQAWVRSGDGYCSLETDLAIAMDHMILAAEAEGIATCWIADFNPAQICEALDLRAGHKIFAITPLGYPRPGFVRKERKSRKRLEAIVRFQ